MVDRSKKQGYWTHEKNLAARRAAGPLKSLAMRTRRSFATLLALPHFVPERRVPPRIVMAAPRGKASAY